MVTNHQTASATECPTVRSPWFLRITALYAPRALATRSPSSVSFTTPR